MRHTSNNLACALSLTTICLSMGASAHADDFRIPNFEKVTPSLWRGGAPNQNDLKQLADSGVRTIVDLRMTPHFGEAHQAEALGMKYVHLPLGYWAPSKKAVSKFFELVADQKQSPVFVHCRQGADRTGTLVALYRRQFLHWPYNQAYSEMRAHHFKPFLFPMRELVEDYPVTPPEKTEKFAAAGKHSGAALVPR